MKITSYKINPKISIAFLYAYRSRRDQRDYPIQNHLQKPRNQLIKKD